VIITYKITAVIFYVGWEYGFGLTTIKVASLGYLVRKLLGSMKVSSKSHSAGGRFFRGFVFQFIPLEADDVHVECSTGKLGASKP